MLLFLVDCRELKTEEASVRKIIFRASGVGAAVALGAAAAALPAMATAAAVPGWRLVFSHQYPAAPASRAQGGFGTVTAISTRDSWAFGGTDDGDGEVGAPVAVRWRDGRWRSSALPHGLTSFINATSAPAANDIWATSWLGGYVLHWNGSRWFKAKAWKQSRTLPRELTGVVALSPSDVWVFGGSGSFPGLGTWHLQGRTWTKVRNLSLSAASAVDARDIWGIAAGPRFPQQSVVRYNGQRWTNVTTRGLGNAAPGDILALSASRIWLAAYAYKNGAIVSDLARWAGGRWQLVRADIPAHSMLRDLTPDYNGGVRFIAQNAAGEWVVHVARSGRVTLGGLPRSVGAVAQIPGTTSLWAAGAYQTKTGSTAAIWLQGKLP